MKSVPEMVSLQKGIFLDKIQCIAYEIICSLFLLNLLNDSSKRKSDAASNFTTNDEELDEEPTNNTKAEPIEKLKKYCKDPHFCYWSSWSMEKYP